MISSVAEKPFCEWPIVRALLIWLELSGMCQPPDSYLGSANNPLVLTEENGAGQSLSQFLHIH